MSATKTYIVGAQKHYRLGVIYEPGERITIPADEKPSKTWVEDFSEEEKAVVEEFRAKKAAEAKPPPAPEKQKRAAYKDAI